tara:strand:- start:3426 stop:3692 length:267 start_codon:yes stop_codon:yes gene_type:complete
MLSNNNKMDSQTKCEMCICPADDNYIITATTRAWLCASCAKDCGGRNKIQQEEYEYSLENFWYGYYEIRLGRILTAKERKKIKTTGCI